MKRITVTLLVAVFALAGGIASKLILSRLEQSAEMILPTFSLPDLSGKLHSISEWQGKIRVINFWATWCPPCRKEIPDLIALQQAYATKGVEVIGIAIDDREAVADYLKETKINYPVLMGSDEGVTLARQLGNTVDAIPFTIIVNLQGKIIFRQPGEFSKEKILEIITPFINL